MSLDGVLETLDIGGRVDKEMQRRGILPPERPTMRGEEYTGGIPANLGDLSPSKLGDWISITTRWCEYIGGCLGEFEAASEAQGERVETVRSFLRRKIKTDREADKKRKGPAPKKYEDDDEIRTHPVFISELAELLELKCLVAVVKRANQAAENNRRAVSNAIRSREAGSKRESRESNVLGAKTSRGFMRRKRP